MATQLSPRVFTTEEQAGNGGFTHEYVIDSVKDLTETTANTSMVFNTFKTIVGDVIEKVQAHLDPPFKDSDDAVFNSTAFSVGDANSATRFFNAVQGNENGTEVIDSYNNTAFGPATAETQNTITVAAMAAKSLSNLDVGRLVVLYKLNRAAKVHGDYAG